MKKLIYITTFLLTASGCFGQKQTGYEHMSPELWQKDLNYLQNKIEKEFNSFYPEVKQVFYEESETVKAKVNQLKNHEVAVEIMRLLSLLKDGHTELNIGHPDVGFHRVPLSLYIFEGSFYILAAHSQYKDLVGGKVTHIGGMPIDLAFEKLKANMSRDNEMEYLHAGPGYIVLTELLTCLGITSDPLAASFTVLKKSGESMAQTFDGLDLESFNNGPWTLLTNTEGSETPLYQTNRGVSYWYRHLPETNTLYFHFGRVNNQKGKPSIRSFSKKLFAEIDARRPDKLIIDLRLNNGGNYNLTRPIVEGIKSREWLNQDGKVWAVTGRRTFSAASTFCIFLKQETQAKLIGEVSRTHPNLADNNEYMTLPHSGFLIEYTTRVKVHWPEKPDLDHIPVDVEIAPTFEAYRKGKDLVMEYLEKY